MTDWKPGTKVPTEDDLEELVFLNDCVNARTLSECPHDGWRGPFRLDTIEKTYGGLYSQIFQGITFYAGDDSASVAVLAEPVELAPHPAAGKLREIIEDLEQDSEAWREWELWSDVLGWRVKPGSLGGLLSTTGENPDHVRRRPRPHRAQWVRHITCGGCGAGPVVESKEGNGEYTCLRCGYVAPIEEE